MDQGQLTSDEDFSGELPFKERLDLLWRVHADAQSGIRLADTKAVAVLGFALAVTGWTINALWQNGTRSQGESVAYLLVCGIIATAAALCVTVWSTVQVVRPMRSGPVEANRRLYFVDIARGTEADFLAVMRRPDAALVTEELARHVWHLSRICTRKYEWVDRSIWAAAGNVICAFVVLLVLGIAGPGEGSSGGVRTA